MGKKIYNIHADLIDQSRKGDVLAQRELYLAYKKAMFNTCYRIVGNYDDAEDVLQDAFVSAFKNLGSYHGEATFGAWLKRIVINKSINFHNKRRMQTVEISEAQENVEDIVVEPDQLTVERVKRAIEQLPYGYRTVLSLYLMEGYDHAEIAGILSISESTSKSQYNRAKSKIREILTKQDEWQLRTVYSR